ncbi:hypothetical protein L916_01474 [Phytophthora nicotianae]|nr:hypothetical protein L916_01474 [Phytophthora nicotianae]
MPTTMQLAGTNYIDKTDHMVQRNSEDKAGELSTINEERQWYEISMRRVKENIKFRYWFKTGKRPQDIYSMYFNSSMDTRTVATDPNFGTFSRYTKYYEDNKESKSWFWS